MREESKYVGKSEEERRAELRSREKGGDKGGERKDVKGGRGDWN